MGNIVAMRFLEEFERIANLLVEYTSLGTPTTKGRRTFPLKGFPYLVVYRIIENHVQILIVRHQHRKPNYADNRH